MPWNFSSKNEVKRQSFIDYKLQVSVCMFGANRSKQAAENFTENWFYTNFVICSQRVSVSYDISRLDTVAEHRLAADRSAISNNL